MNRALPYVLIAVLATACSQARYGHLTVRSSHPKHAKEMRKSDPVIWHASLVSVLPERSMTRRSKPSAPDHILLPIPIIGEGTPTAAWAATGSEPFSPDAMLQEVGYANKTTANRPQQESGLGKTIWTGMSTLIVLFLFCAAIAWVGTLFGIPFWTGMMWMGILLAFILLMNLLGLGEFWAGS